MNQKIWMLISVFSFCLMAIGVKEINTTISPVQIIFFRSLIGLFILLVFVKKDVFKLRFLKIKKHLFRNIFHLLGQYGWIIGISYLSLSEVTAIEFTTPIWIVIIAVIFLKEKVTIKKIVSVSLGFIGVLIIIKPGIAIIDTKSIIILLSAISYAITHIATKKLIKENSAFDVVVIMCLTQVPISFVFTYNVWSWPSSIDYFWLTLVGVTAISAHFSMAKAMKNIEISTIITLDYLRLPILFIIGMLVYKEEFNSSLLIGGILIILGNYTNLAKIKNIRFSTFKQNIVKYLKIKSH